MIDFSPGKSELEIIKSRYATGSLTKYIWDLTKNGIDVRGMQAFAMAVAVAEQQEQRWICAVVEIAENQEILVLTPED